MCHGLDQPKLRCGGRISNQAGLGSGPTRAAGPAKQTWVKTHGPVIEVVSGRKGRHAAIAGWQGLHAHAPAGRHLSTSRLRWPAGSPGKPRRRTGQSNTISRRISGILDHRKIRSNALLDVARLNSQQIARVDALLAPGLHASATSSPIVDAASRFVSRGGSWEPDDRLLQRIDAAALGRLSGRRVRVER